MGVMPVNRLLLTMSLPMMISMLVQALYNVVDSVFVSYISEDALAAVGLAFPAQNLMISVAVGTGVGINALLSKSLGEKNFETANQAAVNGVFLAFCSWAIFAVLGGLFSRTFMTLQTQVDSIISYGTTYLSIVSVVCVGMMFQICFERLLQSTGKTIFTMISQATGAVINLVLDPLLIFGLGPFPEMGIAGAAWATVLGQIVGALLGLYCNLRLNPEIILNFRGFRPSGAIIRKIYAVGVPSIIMSSIGSVMTFGMNKILGPSTPPPWRSFPPTSSWSPSSSCRCSASITASSPSSPTTTARGSRTGWSAPPSWAFCTPWASCWWGWPFSGSFPGSFWGSSTPRTICWRSGFPPCGSSA